MEDCHALTAHFDLVIFDCDGTLVDTEPLHELACIRAFARFGADLTQIADYQARFTGTTIKAIVDIVQQELQVALPFDALLAEIHAQTEVTLKSHIAATKGVAEVLRALPVPACVASNGNRRVVMRSLELTGLNAFFQPIENNIFTACQVERPKPFPDLFLYAASAQDALPARCLVVEDSPAGVTAAKAAGMVVIGYTGASVLRDAPARLRAAGADMVLADYSRFPAVLEACQMA